MLMVDDMITTAGTVTEACKVLKKHGANEIYMSASHAVLAPPAIERLKKCTFTKLAVTDTIPIGNRIDGIKDRVEVLSVAELLGDRNPKCFRQFQVAIDGVGAAIHLCNLMVQQARTLTAIAHSPELARMADAADQGTSEQALKIKGHVRSERLCFF